MPIGFCQLDGRTHAEFDVLNRLTGTIFPATVAGGARTGITNGYDALSRRVAVTNQAGKVTRFGYDAL